METTLYAVRARGALERHGFRFTHSLGQNFLLDGDMVESLVDASGIESGDNVLEIGPGAGLMTAIMAAKGANVLAVELDRSLEDVLSDVLEGLTVRIHYQDVMKCDLAALTQETFSGNAFKVQANLPYYITSDAITLLVKSALLISQITLLVQKEAAERIVSEPGEKSWCALSAFVASYGTAEILREVPPESFIPRPHVMSVLLQITPYAEMPYTVRNKEMLYKVITSAFAMRRKTLANNIMASFSLSRADAEGVLTNCGFDPRVRGETLTVPELARLADALEKW